MKKSFRFKIFILLAALVIGCGIGGRSLNVQAADTTETSLADFTDTAKASGYNERTATSTVEACEPGIRWYNHIPLDGTTKNKVRLKFTVPAAAALDGTESLELRIYSKVANDSTICCEFSAGSYSFRKNITVDWTGWKDISIGLADMTKNNSAASWSDATVLRLKAGGDWGITAKEDTDLYISKVAIMHADATETSLADFTDATKASGYNDKKSTSTVEACVPGEFGIHWYNHIPFADDGTTKNKVRLKFAVPEAAALDGTESLELRIYSAVANGAEICCEFSDNTNSFRKNITVDWTGWKDISIDLDGMTEYKDPSWSDMTILRLKAGGDWGITAKEDTDLYITKVAIKDSEDSSPEVSVNGADYDGTLLEAIAAAEADAVIKLLTDVDLGTESVDTETYFTLDLNGYTLTATSFGKYVNVVDNSEAKTGLLKVAANACTLPVINEQMPVYDTVNGGYVFTTIIDQNDGGSITDNAFQLIFRPSFGAAKNSLLANGGTAAGISIKIRLTWTDATEGAKTQELIYKDDADYSMIADVYTNDKAFYIKASGTENFTDLKVTPYIESTTGVVLNLTTISAN